MFLVVVIANCVHDQKFQLREFKNDNFHNYLKQDYSINHPINALGFRDSLKKLLFHFIKFSLVYLNMHMVFR